MMDKKMGNTTTKIVLILAILLVIPGFVFAGGGQEEAAPAASTSEGPYVPTKDITWVVPFDAGGNSDIPARIFAKHMSKYSDVEVKVTNIVGAGGKAGAREVMKAKPDDSIMLMQPVGYPMQYALGTAEFTYEDFAMIGQWLDSTLAVVVQENSPFKDMNDLLTAAQAAPGTLKMGSVTGTLPLFAIIEIENQKGVEFNKVDLSGASKAPELLSGRIDGYIDGFGAVKQYIESGQFRCLGIISDVKIKGFEDIPTFSEVGFSDYEYLKQAFGLWAPKGTSPEFVEYVNNLIKQAAEDQACIDELQALAYSPAYTTVEEYTANMKKTYAQFVEVAKSILGQ